MTAAHVQRVLDAFEGVRPTGQSQWQARCPSHPDNTPSLAVGVGKDGRVLVRCHADCSTQQVVAAVDLHLADLFGERRSSVSWLRDFVYRDGDGKPLYRIRRGVNRKGERCWRAQHPTSEGWVDRFGDARRVLFRLPELLAQHDLTVWSCEGERDALALAGQGLLTTAVANGKWRGVDLTPLHNRDVVVVIDADGPGWKKGRGARSAISDAGGRVVRVVRPADGLKDAAAHVAAGCSVDLLVPVDLDHDEPPSEPEPDHSRSAYRTDDRALALFVVTPLGVLVGLVQAGRLHDDDVLPWLVLEDRAGDTSEAHVSAAELARVLGRDRHVVAQSLARLTSVGLVAPLRRGRWRVLNPARRSRAGGVDRDLRYATRAPARSNKTLLLPPTTPCTTPPNGADRPAVHTRRVER